MPQKQRQLLTKTISLAIQNLIENLRHLQIQINHKLVHFIYFCMILNVLLETILLYNNNNILFRKSHSAITGYYPSRYINSASPSITVLIFHAYYFKTIILSLFSLIEFFDIDHIHHCNSLLIILISEQVSHFQKYLLEFHLLEYL